MPYKRQGQSTEDELSGLRCFLAAIQSGEITLNKRDEEETQREIEFLKQEIEYLESVLTRLRKDSASTST